MIIDKTYFIREIYLPISQVEAELNGFILRFEPEILLKSLGYNLKNKFDAGLSEGTIEQKWLDLRDGKDYQVDGIDYHWDGFANTKKESLIAYYVYWAFSCFSATYTTAFGQKVSKSENSVFADARNKQAYAYNKCVDMIGSPVIEGSLHHFLSNNLDVYPEFLPQTLNKVNIFNI